ncbi:MAG: hypothetical protein U0805_22745 [Pirellulales bacterium]
MNRVARTYALAWLAQPLWWLPLRLLIILAIDVFGVICFAEAAPATFRFDATITETFVRNSIDLPFAYQVGDRISGTLTFDPATSAPITPNAVEAVQTLGLTFDIAGVWVGTSTYGIRAVDENIVTDGVLQGPVDTMTIGCSTASSPQPCTPALVSLPSAVPFSIETRLNLIGANSIFATAQVSDDPAVWNSFLFERTFGLAFRTQNAGFASMSGTLGDFSSVPEPRTFALVGSVILWAETLVTRRRRLKEGELKGTRINSQGI